MIVIGPAIVSNAEVPELATFPADGSTTASAATQISVRNTDPNNLSTPEIVGALSGPHDGKWTPHSDGIGASFFVNKPFTEGEQVTALIYSTAGGVVKKISFDVATTPEQQMAPSVDPQYPELFVNEATPAQDVSRMQAVAVAGPETLGSRTDLKIPVVSVATAAAGRGQGLILTAPQANSKGAQAGLLIHDDQGEPVWFRPSQKPFTGNLQKVTWKGQPALSFFEGITPFPGVFEGEWPILDQTYTEVARIKAGNGYLADVHELLVKGDSAYIVAYPQVVKDLTAVGGLSNAVILDAVIQEIDVATGAVLFEWHALDHMPVTDTYINITLPVIDFFHINSVDVERNGNLLVSGRHISAVVEVDTTGNVLWTLGGKHSSYTFVNDAGQSFQHDARRLPDGTISLFDNGVGHPQPRFSRTTVWRLDDLAKTATLVTSHRQSPDVYTEIQGSSRLLAGGSTFSSWGTSGSEIEWKGSTVVFDAKFADPAIFSYRAYREPWTATPAELPAASVFVSAGVASAAASWNGATEVRSWRLLAGPSPAELRVIGEEARQGFETVIQGSVGPADSVFAVVPMNSLKQALSSSSPVAASTSGPGGWSSVGGIVSSRPSVAAQSLFGQRVIAVQAPDQVIYIKNAAAPGDWTSAGGITAYAPGQSSGADGPPVIAITGSDGQVHVKDATNYRATFTPRGGVGTSSPAAASTGQNRLDLFVRGTDNALWQRTYVGESSPGWRSLGGVLTSGAGVTTSVQGRLDVVVTGTDRGVWHAWYNDVTGQWSPWENLGGVVRDQPTIVAEPGGRFAVLATGADRAVWTSEWTGVQWSGWRSLGGISDQGPAATARPDGLSDIFVRGADGAVWTRTG